MIIRSVIRRSSRNAETTLGKLNETEYKKLKIQWKKKNIYFDIFDVSPCNKKNAEMLEIKNMDIIKYMKTEKVDMVIFGIGYVDYDKILKSFNRAHIIKNKNIDSVHINLKKVNGQYTSIIQQCLLSNIPHFCLGRDRLTEMASIGSAIFSNPKEVLSLVYYFIVNSAPKRRNKRQMGNNDTIDTDDITTDTNLSKLAPNFYKALIVENALYLSYNIHAKLLQILKSDLYVPPHEMGMHGNREQIKRGTTTNNTNTTNTKKKYITEKMTSFFKETTHDQIKSLRNRIVQSELHYNFDLSDGKKDLHILVLCDTICVDYFFHFLLKNFPTWYNVPPFYNELFNLEKKNSYKYSLSLFLFVMAPFAWTITLLIKYFYYLWVEYFTKGKVITVGGDIFFQDSKLIDLQEDTNNPIEEEHFEQTLKKKKRDFETVTLLGGLLQWFKDKSRN